MSTPARRCSSRALALALLAGCGADAPPRAPAAASPPPRDAMVDPTVPGEAPRPSSSPTPPPTSTAPASAEPVGGAGAEPTAEVPPPGYRPIPARRPAGFPGLPFEEVRAFAFDLEVSGRPVCQGPLDPDGTLCSTVHGSGTTLTGDQIVRLRRLLQAPRSFGGGASCWLPHHGFVFYDAAGAPIAELSVCFLCDMVAARPLLPVGRADPAGRVGVTEAGRDGLLELCRELGLPKCDARTPDDFQPRR